MDYIHPEKGKILDVRAASLPNGGNIVMIDVWEKDGVRTMRTRDGLEVVEDDHGRPWIPSTRQRLSW